MTDGSVRSGLSRTAGRLRTALALAVLPGFLVGCASSGSGPDAPTETVVLLPARAGFDPGDFTNQPSSVRDTVLEEPRERVWATLPYVFRTLGVETTTIAAGSYAIGNEGWRPAALHGTRLSSFLQCGSGVTGPNADTYEVTMQLLVQLESRGATSTLVRVVMDAFARPRYASGTAIQCATQGTLEGRIVRLLEEGMARGEGEGGGLVASGLGPSPAGPSLRRLPSVGEFVRVGCASAPGGDVRLAEGSFRGASDGQLLIGVAPSGRDASVPTSSISSIQIRERRSRARIGAVVFGTLAAGAGAYVGSQKYNPDGKLHFGPGVITTVGGVIGLMGGALIGAIAGSLLDYDVWLDVTPDWHARFGAPGSAPVVGTAASTGAGCAGLDSAR